MKQILLTLAFAAFTVAAQAGETKDAKTTSTEKSSCCSQAKASEQTKACDDSKASCCAAKTKTTSVKQALLSPKAAGEVTKKL